MRNPLPPRVLGSSSKGFTLVELMIGILVLAILITLAAPSFSQLIINTRLTSQANELVGDIAYARNESATRGVRITLCPSTDGATCTGGSWEGGRILFVDNNGDGARQNTETLLRIGSALSGGNTLVSSGFATANYIQFRPYGGLNPPTRGDFKLCPASSSSGRNIAVAAFGTPTTTTVSCP